MNRTLIVPISNSAQQPPTLPALPAQHIPLLTILAEDAAVRCDGQGSVHEDDLTVLVETLFDESWSDEWKAARLFNFVVNVEAVVRRADPEQLRNLDNCFMIGKLKLFPMTNFSNTAMETLEASCLTDSVLKWNVRDKEQCARLNADNNSFELLPEKSAKEEKEVQR